MAQKSTSSPPRKLVFEVGARLEAMDFTQNWYSAKICRIDDQEKKALIHFEGWNHRYDEWIEFDSDRLRPHHRLHLFQEAKEEKKDECDYQDWGVGDRVLAKWLDCKYYPAKVVKCNPEGTCEVLFYDGVKKTVQRINMKPDNKKTILMPAIKELDAGERQKRRIEMASARAARARKRSKEEASSAPESTGKRKDRVKRGTSWSASTEESEVSGKGNVTSPTVSSSLGEVHMKQEPIHRSPAKDVKDVNLEAVPSEPEKQVLAKVEKQVLQEQEMQVLPEAEKQGLQEPEKQVSRKSEKQVLQEPEIQLLPEPGNQSSPEPATKVSSEAVQEVLSEPEKQVSQEKQVSSKPEKQVSQEKQVSSKPAKHVSPPKVKSDPSLEEEQPESPPKLKPLVFVKYKTEEECLKSPDKPTDMTVTTTEASAEVASHKTRENVRVFSSKSLSARVHSADSKTVVHERTQPNNDFPLDSQEHGNVNVLETDRTPDITDRGKRCLTPESGSAASDNSNKSGEVYTDSTKNKTSVKDETMRSDQFSDGSTVETWIKSSMDDNACVEEPKVSTSASDVRQRVMTSTELSAVAKKPKLKYTSAGPKLKTTRTRGGKTASRKRGRGGRSTLNPRGYGYSMAFMPQQTSENNAEQADTSAAEDAASAKESGNTSSSGVGMAAATGGTKPIAAKSQSYQAKKHRLDQITGKLSAQRQCEAKASIKSPSAFQAASHSPPPPHLPPSPVSLPPAQAPSPSSVPSPYPMESYPPALLYAHSLAPPCCTNPHHQHSPVYPPSGPPPHSSIPHGMHLQARHVHPHQEFHPQSSGYMVYPPHQSAPFPRPCMASCCQHVFHPLPPDSCSSPPSHESALVRLMQCEQRMLHPPGAMPCFREMSPSGPWTTSPRHPQGPSSHYMPGPHTHEDRWRTPTEGLPGQTSPSPSLSPVAQSDSSLARQQSKRSRKSERPLPTSTKSLPATPALTPASTDPTPPSDAPDISRTDPDKPATAQEQQDAKKEKDQTLLSASEHGQTAFTSTASKAPASTPGATATSPAAPVPPSVPSSGSFVPSSGAPFGGTLHANRPRKGKEGVAPKELVIEIDHNKYKCRVPGCDKSFRKESGLEYHMKYYHSEKNSKRKRTSASARLDSGSDISPESSGPRKTKRRFHRYSAPGHLSNDPPPLLSPVSAPETDLGTSAVEEAGEKPEPEQEIEPGTESEGLELGAGESVEVEEEDDQDADVIRCICNEIEEGGFMIQCEQCLTWQHSDCLGLNEETVPSNYLCHCCSNPKGLRLNAKYRNDHDWFRRGTLSSFPFLRREDSEYEVELTCATHDLVSDVHNVSTVLQSLRVKLELLREPSNPQMELWKSPEPDTATAVDSVETARDISSGGTTMASEESTISGKQTEEQVKVKIEPCVNGIQPSDGSVGSSDGLPQEGGTGVADQNPKEKPEGDSEGASLGVVKEEASPSSPLPALIPANGAEQEEPVDAVVKEDVQSSKEKQAEMSKQEDGGAKQDVVSPMEVDSKDTGTTGSPASSLTKLEEPSVDVQGEAAVAPDVAAVKASESATSAQHHGPTEGTAQEEVEKKPGKEPLSAVENLLDDITKLQDEMDTRMTQIDKQLSVLEDAYSTPFPMGHKPDLRKLVKDLSHVRRMLHHVR